MALVVKDRVKETCSAPGTGTVTLLGASTGYVTFATIGDGNTTYYTIADQGGSKWEVGIGTYTLSGTTLSRDTVLSNSSGNTAKIDFSSGTTLSRDTVLSNSAGTTAKINFSSGTQDVFVTYPSEVSIYSSNNAGTTGQLLKSNGTGTAPSWQDYLTYLPVLTRAGSTTNVTITNGYLPVLTRGGSTTSVPVY